MYFIQPFLIVVAFFAYYAGISYAQCFCHPIMLTIMLAYRLKPNSVRGTSSVS